jgi:hypothetical protein
VNVGVIGIIAVAILLIAAPHFDRPNTVLSTATTTETAAVSSSFAAIPTFVIPVATTSISNATSTPPVTKHVTSAPIASTKKPATSKQAAASASTTAEATRLQNPYTVSAESFDVVNAAARSALVNILCMPRGGGSLSPTSGSGVIIDPRGVILTNAHVAQYVLLSESQNVDLECQIRTGTPAMATWTAEVLYIPPVWVAAHASEINTSHPTGTGEHDYALLRITGAVSGKNVPATFPSVPFDTRDAIAFLGDNVLGASYPAEFLGGMDAENDLYSVSSISPINQLLTFGTSTVDVIAIGGVVEAQSGSSGGAVVNAWGHLVGLITTTSDAPTTAARDLRAITLSYINRDIRAQSGMDLPSILSGDLASEEAYFNANTASGLLRQYLKLLSL